MDTLKIMLGATIALLLVAVGLSWKSMQEGVAGASQEDVTAMRRQLEEIRQETERLELEKERRALREVATAPSANDVVTRADAAVFEERLRELEAETEAAKEAAIRAEADALRAEKETDFLLDNRDNSARRMRVINDAMLIATVREWVEDPQFGGFATLEVRSPENIQSGTVLAIRRNGGILGKLRVGEVSIDGAVANPLTPFGEVKPQSGDELILDEVVKLAN